MGWVLITLFAACAQGTRTGMQKHLAETVDKTTANFARYIFGVPLLLALLALSHYQVIAPFNTTLMFYGYCVLLAGFQLLGTAFMLTVFRRKNYIMGVAFARTEALLVAVIGLLFFTSPVSLTGALAVIIGVVGVLLLSKIKLQTNPQQLRQTLQRIRTTPTRQLLSQSWLSLSQGSFLLGIGSGMAFAFTAWFIRLANAELDSGPWLGPLLTLGLSNLIQITLVVLIAAISGRLGKLGGNIVRNWKLVSGVGIMSIAGSWGWFTAYGMAHPAYVKTVGQTEMLVVYFISRKMFHERLSRQEALGIALIILSVVVLAF